MPELFHLVDRDVWADAVRDGEYRPPSLVSEGFVHFSYAEQVAGTANLLYADAGNLCVIEFDALRFGLPVVVEQAPGTGQSFPHVYGPIPTSAAVAVHDLERAGDGAWLFSAGGATSPASPGR